MKGKLIYRRIDNPDFAGSGRRSDGGGYLPQAQLGTVIYWLIVTELRSF